MEKQFRAYVARNVRLKAIGYRTYWDYLQSPEWKALRSKVLQRFGWRCWRCGGKAAVVHHWQYTKGTLRGHNCGGLVPLCDPCHDHGEKDGDRKCTLEECNRRLGINLNRRCVRCGRHRPWHAFRFANSIACRKCPPMGGDVEQRRRRHKPGGKGRWLMVGGPHDGETFRPTLKGKLGLPTLVSRDEEIGGSFGTARSTYEYDPREKVYRHRATNIIGAANTF